MKFEFDSPLDLQDGAAMSAAEIASLQYIIFVDTVNPPVKSYPVPAANVAAATKNANGSYHVTVDCNKGDLVGFTPVAGTTYYCAVEDSISENGAQLLSPESNVITFVNTVIPQTPGNFTVVS